MLQKQLNGFCLTLMSGVTNGRPVAAWGKVDVDITAFEQYSKNASLAIAGSDG
jgi:hypothetical protein